MSENEPQDKTESLPDEMPQAKDPIHEASSVEDEQLSEPNPNSNPEILTMETDDIDSLKQLLAEKDDQLLRSVAETENVRKRGRKEAEEARKYASTGLLLDLLTVVDDLNRALESAAQNEDSQGIASGVKMVAGQLETVLEKHHCKQIDALGKPFDPNLHEAIQMQPSEEYAANHVSLVARTGYQLYDRVLRTAQVFVSTGKPDSGE